LNSWAYDPNAPLPQKNIERARNLLHEAGWIARNDLQPRSPSDTDEDLLPSEETAPRDALRYKGNTPFEFTLLASSDQLEVARELARQWRVVGVNASVQEIQQGLASNYLQARQYQAAVANINFDTPDPDPYPFWHETRAGAGQNYSQFRDRDMSELLEQARRTVDQSQRAQLYSRFMQLFIDYMPALPLYYPLYNYAVNERIRDVQPGQMLIPADRFFTIADWFVIERRVIVNSGAQLLSP
jgi:peptide/nickel transport system substrate-binding protein